MMNDLISRKALIDDVNKSFVSRGGTRDDFLKHIQFAPAVNAEPVKYENWIVKQHGKNPGNYTCFCSGCKTEGSLIWKRCPVCEAKMTKEVQE